MKMEQLMGQGKDRKSLTSYYSTNCYFCFTEGSGGIDIECFTEELEAETINILSGLQVF